LDSTFIGKQAKYISQGVDAMGAILKLDNIEYKAVTNPVLRSFANNEFLSGDTLEKTAIEIKSAFLDYVIQTNTGYNEQIAALNAGDTPEKPADQSTEFSALKQENVELKGKVTSLETKNTEYEAKVSTLETQFTELKTTLDNALKEAQNKGTNSGCDFGGDDKSKEYRAAV